VRTAYVKHGAAVLSHGTVTDFLAGATQRVFNGGVAPERGTSGMGTGARVYVEYGAVLSHGTVTDFLAGSRPQRGLNGGVFELRFYFFFYFFFYFYLYGVLIVRAGESGELLSVGSRMELRLDQEGSIYSFYFYF
jgi:hypothetical protein